MRGAIFRTAAKSQLAGWDQETSHKKECDKSREFRTLRTERTEWASNDGSQASITRAGIQRCFYRLGCASDPQGLNNSSLTRALRTHLGTTQEHTKFVEIRAKKLVNASMITAASSSPGRAGHF